MSGSNTVPPISSHPAFSKAVAIWFSALFGLSLLVLPHFAIEGMLGAVGLRSAVTFFAAPLSVAAHLTVCVFGAVVGAFVGLAIARRLAGSAVNEEEGFVDTASEPIVSETAELDAAVVTTPLAATSAAEAPAEPEPAPLPEMAEPEIVEEAPAPSTARGSIADRLASRVRASENVEPSISDDVAALAAGNEAREAEQAEALTQEPVYEPAPQAAEAIDEETVSSADILLAKMPTVERGDEWQSQQHADISANADADADEGAQDILNAADPLYDYDPADDSATSGSAEDFEVEEVESFLEESLIEDEPSDDVSVEVTTPVETDEMQSADYGFEGVPEEAPTEVAPAMSAEPEPVQEAPPEFTPEFTPELETKLAHEPMNETKIAPESVFEETQVESEVATAEAEASEPDTFETNTSEAPKPETGRKPDLGQMLARLEGAIGSFETADETPQDPASEGDAGGSRDDDGVVINLRQEAASSGAGDIAPGAENDAEEDPEESLRKALDRLTQVSGTA